MLLVKHKCPSREKEKPGPPFSEYTAAGSLNRFLEFGPQLFQTEETSGDDWAEGSVNTSTNNAMLIVTANAVLGALKTSLLVTKEASHWHRQAQSEEHSVSVLEAADRAGLDTRGGAPLTSSVRAAR